MVFIFNFVIFYIDGVCFMNFGFGGYGVVIFYGDGCWEELFVGYKMIINNCMEIMGAIVVLSYL